MTAELVEGMTDTGPLHGGGRLHRLRHHHVAVWVTMLLASAASLVASFVLSIDAITLARDPTPTSGATSTR